MKESTRTDLERKVADATREAANAEHYGWIVACLVAALLGFVVTWFVSIPLSIAVYLLMNTPRKKALAQAEADLQAYNASQPPSTFY